MPTAEAAGYAAFSAFAAADYTDADYTATYAPSAAHDATFAAYNAYAVRDAAECVYYALIACIEAGDEAAYNRIIALTNEMLESL